MPVGSITTPQVRMMIDGGDVRRCGNGTKEGNICCGVRRHGYAAHWGNDKLVEGGERESAAFVNSTANLIIFSHQNKAYI